MLMTMGFESAAEVPIDVVSQLVSRHICKLGRILKLLTDSYKKESSAMQLIKVSFFQVICEDGSIYQ